MFFAINLHAQEASEMTKGTIYFAENSPTAGFVTYEAVASRNMNILNIVNNTSEMNRVRNSMERRAGISEFVIGSDQIISIVASQSVARETVRKYMQEFSADTSSFTEKK